LDINSVILFGHSDGGSIALIAAADYPTLFKEVIVEAAHVFVEEVTLQGIRVAVDEYASTNLKTRLEKYHGDKAETLFKAWTNTWLSEEFRSWNIEHLLSGIACPVLFLQGEDDEFGTVKQVEAVKKRIPTGVQTILIPKVRHTPHKEVPEFVIETASDFILSECRL
jgi:pimeloyl-ACP methyl ester carboxylesterase